MKASLLSFRIYMKHGAEDLQISSICATTSIKYIHPKIFVRVIVVQVPKFTEFKVLLKVCLSYFHTYFVPDISING